VSEKCQKHPNPETSKKHPKSETFTKISSLLEIRKMPKMANKVKNHKRCEKM
jgi:hypothetical protein